MLTVKFFFYNKMKNPENLDLISSEYISYDSYIFVDDYNLKTEKIILKNKNKKKLVGKYVEFFNKDMIDILSKINNIFLEENNKKNNKKRKNIREFIKKNDCLNKVLDYIPEKFYIRKYKIIKINCYLKGKSVIVNLII